MNLKLSHTLVLLVAVPLAFELFFVGTLSYLLDQVEQERVREAHARDLSKHLTRIHQILLGGIAYSSNAAIAGSDGVAGFSTVKSSGVSGEIYKEFAIIDQLIKDRPEEQEQFAKVKSRLMATWDEVRNIRIKWHEPGAQSALDRIDSLKPYFRAITFDIEALTTAEERIEVESPIKQRKQRELIKTLLFCGVVFNVALALFLALYFNRNITNRLGTLIENIRLLGANLPLHPPLSGNDELAQVDRAFADMVQRLKAAKAKERVVLENLRVILESLPVGVLLLKEDGEIEMANSACTKMLAFGAPPVRRNIRDVVYFADGSGSSIIGKAEESSHWSEQEAIRKDGRTLPVEFGIRRIDTHDGERILTLMVDITQRREIERLKQEFLSMVSHDLRTPLNSMQAFLELVADGIYGELNEAGSKKVALLESEVQRLMRLIQQLLDLDRLESGTTQLVLQNQDGLSLIRRAESSVRSLAEQRGIRLEVMETNTAVKADADKIVQVLVNLLSNAIKFSPDGGKIFVSLARQGNVATFKVGDQGRGIPQAVQERIFERFKQVKKSDATEKGGAGLGLAICKTIIEQHGGKIGVESQEGAGATFWFKLPVA